MVSVRRITKRRIGKNEFAISAALIGGELRVGTLDGVHVDFRHPQLPPDFEAPPWWPAWGAPPYNAGLVFPVAAAHGIEEIPDCEPVYVRAGDRISVESVETTVADARFDDPHDREARLATLKIERPNGKTATAGPLAFFGNSRLLEGGIREAFDHMIERLLRHNGVDEFPAEYDADGGYTPLWMRPLEEIALAMARDAHGAAFELLDTLAENDPQRSRLRRALNRTALAGFLLGKFEAREATERAERQVRVAQSTGADKTPPRLLKIAREMADANPDWTRNKLSIELEDSWERDRRSIIRTLKLRHIGPEPKK
jgi:hypothetical protein